MLHRVILIAAILGLGTADWTRFFSEEEVSEYTTQPIQAIQCQGGYCDDTRFFTKEHDNCTLMDSYDYANFMSEEQDPSYCQEGEFLIGWECDYRYCDNKKIRCGRFTCKSSWPDISQSTDWFSEEQPSTACPVGMYAVGIGCRGDYCDDLTIYCAYML